MNILLLSQWFDPEPGAIRGMPLAKWLTSRGHKVTVLTTFPNYPMGKIYDGYSQKLRSKEKIDNVDIIRVPIYPSHDSSFLKRMLSYSSFVLSSSILGIPAIGNIDVVYVLHPPPLAITALLLKLFKKIPIAYNIPDMWPDSVLESGMTGKGIFKRFTWSVLFKYCNFVYKHCSAISVLSYGFRDILIERGVEKEKVHVIYNWTNEEFFKPQEKDTVLASELSFDGKFNVVYAGNLGTLQGLETAIEAAKLLENEKDIQLVFIGAGQCEDVLKAKAKKLNLTNIRFVGRRDMSEMPAINSISDCLLVHLRDIPLMRSTIPSKTQVALASGRPIIMSVAGEAPKVIQEANAGFVCQPEDPSDLASAILKMFNTSKKDREEMGKNALTYYHKNMSLEVGGKLTETMLEQICHKIERSELAMKDNGY